MNHGNPHQLRDDAVALHADIRNVYLGHEGDRKIAAAHLGRIVRIESGAPLSSAEITLDREAVIRETAVALATRYL